jgi:guanylate kinase
VLSGKHGRLVVVSAPSGAGKTTLVHEIIRRHPEIRFSISYTTRPPRKSETNGRDYFFVDENKFHAMLLSDAFLESARVFGHWYGTSWEYVSGFLKQGNTVLLEIDWQGANQVCLRMPEAIGIFILPPNRQELERRLRGRGTDSDGAISRRLRDALTDMLHWKEFDYVLVSDDVGKCADAFEGILDGQGELNRVNSLPTQERVAQILDSDT